MNMKKGLILEWFPTPNYLRMPAVGIDISDKSLKYIELSKKKGNFLISRYGTRIVPEGIIEEGQIKQKRKLVEFLKSINEELKVKFVNVSLPEEKAFLSRIELPLMKEEEIKNALEFQMEEHIPLSSSDAIFDFEIAKKEEVGKRDDCFQVNLVAYPKLLIENYRDSFVEAGFTPLVFEMETQAFARTMVAPEDKESYFLVDFGKTRISFAIVSDGKIQFTSTIKISGDDLNNALMKDLDIDFFRAEEIKKERGLIKSKNNEKIFNALLSVASVIKDEINKHIIYWNSHLSDDDREQKKIKKILLCGGDSNLTGFPEYLSYELKLPTELCNPWVNIISFEEYVPAIELGESLIYTVALGLALRSFSLEK
ncbi:type IV pilus assembly protein PilM [Patescibacteria group bacterium]|nr:type IV pilus assembly protein PilM [Patescibacteria group bacterium]